MNIKDLQNTLGFTWDSAVFPATLPPPDMRRACFRVKKLFPEFIWDTTVLEDNPFTFPEVKTLLEGITVGGHTLSDEQQVLNQAESWRYLLHAVANQQFSLTKAFFCALNNLVAKEEALTWGVFRDGPVSIAGTQHAPPPTSQLDACFEKGLAALLNLCNPLEQGMAFFLFGALHQFFYDGNKRTSRLMMNGILLTQGLDAISVPAKSKQNFNKNMIYFYDHKDATDMMTFLLSCRSH